MVSERPWTRRTSFVPSRTMPSSIFGLVIETDVPTCASLPQPLGNRQGHGIVDRDDRESALETRRSLTAA